jgi:hypothetical protein
MRKLFVSSRSVVGTNPWGTQEFSFRAGPETRLIILRVARRISHKFDNKIAGRAWITRVRLAVETNSQGAKYHGNR